ncbi:MAG: hypothetical protein IT445_01580 [Phycisphaeraceae bacterium]|nr:hypothetical protein [Phycisphaeraceae bacterium]
MRPEQLLLLRIYGDHLVARAIDRELDRRAVAGGPIASPRRRQVAPASAATWTSRGHIAA